MYIERLLEHHFNRQSSHGKLRTDFQLTQSPPVDISVLVQETPFTDSQHKEINGLLKKGVFAVIMERDVLQGTCIFNLCFVDEIKYPSTDKAFEKSRLVIQAYND